MSKKFINLIVLLAFVSLFNELCDLFSGCVPEGDDVVIFVSTLAMKILAKATAILVPMAFPYVLGSFSIKLEGVLP